MILLLAFLLILIGFASDGGERSAEVIGFVVGVVAGVHLVFVFLKWLLGATITPKRYT